jgi:DNA primase
MKFPPSVLEEIKARLPASAVVGRRVRLSKAGREWKGLSPFNKEKSPSFFVNDTKQAWFDFSSGRNGDIFKFVMETEGLSFPEAVERLAAEAGVVLPRMTEEAERHETVRKGLHEAMEIAAAWFEACLHGEGGGAARRYLAGRGLDGQIAHEFRLGYAPNQRFALRDHLAGKGVSAEVMSEAGLLIHGEDIAVPYDRFRDRVMFPIWDQKGRVVAFGGRAMSADQPAKYLNSPETPLFHKGQLLYNHHRARKAAHDRGQGQGQASGSVIAVEGYVDVIAMHRVGFPQTVAPLGTALTEDQMGLMWRMADEPILCFDGDGAGRRAAFRAIDVALPKLEPGKSLRFAFLPDGQDPDDLSRSGGASAIQGVIAAARPLVDVVWAREIETMPVDTPERRAAFERRLREVLGQIRDESIRRHYQDEVGERLRQLFSRGQPQPRARGRQQGTRQGGFGGESGGRKFGERGRMPPEPMIASPSLARSRLYLSKDLSRSGESPREAFILLGLAANAEMLAQLGEEIVELDFSGREALRFGQMLLDVVASGEVTGEALARRQSSAHIAAAREALSAAIRPGDARRLIQDADPTQLSDSIRQAILLHRRARTLHSDLKAAEAALAEDMSEANFAWVRDIKARLESLDGTEADPDDVA